jgi:hypothetical protein
VAAPSAYTAPSRTRKTPVLAPKPVHQEPHGKRNRPFNRGSRSIELESVDRGVIVISCCEVEPFREELARTEPSKLIVCIEQAAEWEMGWETFGTETSVAADVVVD